MEVVPYGLEDTGGTIMPFDFDYLGLWSPIASLRYRIPTKNQTGGFFPYIEFMFYSQLGNIVDFTIIAPGQDQSPCLSFDGRSEVTAYSGVASTLDPPSDLLEWINEGSP